MNRNNRQRVKSEKRNHGGGRGSSSSRAQIEVPPVRAHGSEIFTDRTWTGIADSLGLSGRELQITRGVFDNRTEAAIAADLDISPHTVHSYLKRLHQKLHVVNRVELVLRVTSQVLASR